jgi:hypothetical protein
MNTTYDDPNSTNADWPSYQEGPLVTSGSVEDCPVIIPERKVYPRLDKFEYSFNRENRKQQVSIPTTWPRFMLQRNNLPSNKR